MNIKLKHARQTLTSYSGRYRRSLRQSGPPLRAKREERDAGDRGSDRRRRRGAPALGARWTVIAWNALALLAVALRYALGSIYLKLPDPEKVARRWRVYFALAEAPPAAPGRDRHPAAAFAGSQRARLRSGRADAGGRHDRDGRLGDSGGCRGRAVADDDRDRDRLRAARRRTKPITLSLLCGGILVYFIVLANRLHRTALAGLSYQAEKDALIAELEQAKLNSDEARRRAEGANLAKSRFLATMSHELRTPLNAILGFSEVMKAELFGPHNVPTYKEYANDIHSSGQHLLMLINEILDLSRVEAGRYELKEEAVSLPGVVEECRHLLALRAKNRAINILEMLDSDLPRIWADERAVRQVTLNLLSNAIKFTPQGGEITIKVGWTNIGGQYLSIRDTGPAFPRRKSRSCCPRSDAARWRRRTPTKAPASACRSCAASSNCTAANSS